MSPARPGSLRPTLLTSIRPLDVEDLDAVAGLYESVLRSGSDTPAPGLREFFQRVLATHPWVDEDIPSLVATDTKGHVVGFIGSHVRRRPSTAGLAGLPAQGRSSSNRKPVVARSAQS